MLAKLHVWDDCNLRLRCDDCHWFSEPVNMVEPDPEALLSLVESHPEWTHLVVTGGEPTMWSGFTEFIDALPRDRAVIVYSTGAYFSRLEQIKRKDLSLVLHVGRQIEEDCFRHAKLIAEERSWKCSLVTYNPEMRTLARVLPNQVQEGRARFSQLVGEQIRCKPAAVYVGTDAEIYWCERGLRTKRVDLRRDVDVSSVRCVVEDACLSCFVGEQSLCLKDR